MDADQANPIQAEAQRITDEFLKLTEPNSPNKTHFMVKISPDFLLYASSKDMGRLLTAIPVRNLYFSNLNGNRGIFAFAKPDKHSKVQLKRSQTSVLERLEDKSKEVKGQPTPEPLKNRKRGAL